MTMPTVAQMIVWIVVGLIGGGLASRLITWDREGFGSFRNLGLGLVGALIGGYLFRWLDLRPASTRCRSRCATSWPRWRDPCWCWLRSGW